MATRTEDGNQLRYKPGSGHWDEALQPSGTARRHWRQLAVAVGRMGFGHLKRRWQVGQQLIQANGMTYNVYGDPQGKERPWLMDPIPLLIDSGEWQNIERAVIQRATLLNAAMQDLYGEQRLIRQRHLPATLLYANPHFLRPCFGLHVPDGVYLHSYAADLARSPDGRWWVITDRTQAPSGIGYALENRVVSARTLPAEFNQCRVRPLNRFFEKHRDALQTIAARGRDNSRVVLLSPGPNNETYFEHSYLARHWGFPLVEGADLTVRDNHVYLKTLAGLEPVDLILRRLDDSFCDPLELRGDSLLGVPGLTQAARSGNVTIANALGSGVMETPAHLAFLPNLSQLLLGEELLLPSVATWWCGQDAPRQYVLDHLEQLVLKPTFPRVGKNPEFPAYMDAKGREALKQRIAANPEDYVAQEMVALSTAPVLVDSGLAPRHIVMRVFACWDGSGYSVLPGALTRCSTEDSSPVVSMQLGGGSKDTWVLTRRGEQPAFPRLDAPPQSCSIHTADLPSRVADNQFWLGRYVERVESGVRLVRALLPGLSGEEDFGRFSSVETATQFLIALGFLPEEFRNKSIAMKRWQVGRLLSGLVYDPSRTSGIGWNLKNLRRVSWPLKERLSQDTWRALQEVEAQFSLTPPASSEHRWVAQMNLLDRVILTLSAISGLLTENTTRSHGWLFTVIGKRMERALQTADLLLAAMADAPFEIEASLETLLQIADSAITYRRRYFTSMHVENVLELLLADETNPRSLGFQVAAIAGHVRRLPGYGGGADDVPAPMQIADRILARVRGIDLDDLAARDADGNLAALEELLVGLKGELYDFSDAISARHFSHLVVTRLSPYA